MSQTETEFIPTRIAILTFSSRFVETDGSRHVSSSGIVSNQQ